MPGFGKRESRIPARFPAKRPWSPAAAVKCRHFPLQREPDALPANPTAPHAARRLLAPPDARNRADAGRPDLAGVRPGGLEGARADRVDAGSRALLDRRIV